MTKCDICPQLCELDEKQVGACRVRKCVNNEITPIAKNWASSLCYDPVEKKNIYHWYPGSYVLSVGGWGCNLGCQYCFDGDTQVITNNGSSDIRSLFDFARNVHIDDIGTRIGLDLDIHVASATGCFQKLERIFELRYSGNITNIKPYYLPEITCTPEHKLLCSNGTSVPEFKCARDLCVGDYLVIPKPKVNMLTTEPIIIDTYELLVDSMISMPKCSCPKTNAYIPVVHAKTLEGWTSKEIGKSLGISSSFVRQLRSKSVKLGISREVGALTIVDNDYVRYPMSQGSMPRYIKLNERIARFLGLFCAEGSVVKSKDRPNSLSIVFSFGHSEDVLAQEIVDTLRDCFSCKSNVLKTRTTLRVYTSSVVVGRWLETLCGSKAVNKKVPSVIFDAGLDIKQAFLDGYIDGDGHRYPGGKVSAGSVSKTLIYDIAWISLQCNNFASIYKGVLPNTTVIEGRVVNQLPQYQVVWYTQKHITDGSRDRKLKESEDSYLVPIRTITSGVYDGLVYDLQVANEHTFLANMVGVHNCMNSRISQSPLKIESSFKTNTANILEMLAKRECIGVHFGYSEPTVLPEWIIETAEAIKPTYKIGVGTNGFMTSKTCRSLLPIVDQWQVSFRGFEPSIIETITHVDGALVKQAALDSLEEILAYLGHAEVTYIIIPNVTDGPQLQDFFETIANLNGNIPVHLLAHSPHFKDMWTIPTLGRMLQHVELGKACGLSYVYAENVGNRDSHTTRCLKCNKELLVRDDLFLLERYDTNGICECGERIFVIE